MRVNKGRAGFTLIELLLVVVIIGVLAAISLPKFATTKERSYVATMQSDLHNLISMQEAYLADNGTYYSGAIPNLAVLPYRPSTGTTVTIVLATAAGWQATASYANTTRTCAVYYGNIPALAPATVDGEPKCTP
jgi:type IV pilus assembly protein PilA